MSGSATGVGVGAGVGVAEGRADVTNGSIAKAAGNSSTTHSRVILIFNKRYHFRPGQCFAPAEAAQLQ